MRSTSILGAVSDHFGLFLIILGSKLYGTASLGVGQLGLSGRLGWVKNLGPPE